MPGSILLLLFTDQAPPLPVSDLALFVVGIVITTIGIGTIAVLLSEGRSRDRILLWFGLFAAPYGLGLIFKTTTFALAFGRPQGPARFIDRFLDFAINVPALLLFQEFYGKGWRGMVRWLLWGYVFFAVSTFSWMLYHNRPDLVPAPGTGMVLLLPVMLLVGHLTGYRAPPVAHGRVLLWGVLIFFLAFSRDHLVNLRDSAWHPGVQPYGFLILVFCLGYVSVLRVTEGEQRLRSLTEEMRAATQLQNSILPQVVPSAGNLAIALRYSPMTAVAGDFYDFLAVDSGSLGILVADVTGHGVPAALVASMVKIAASMQAESASQPEKVIGGLNSILCHHARGQYLTAVYVYLDAVGSVGTYCAAGHPPPLLWRRTTRKLQSLREAGLLLGVRPNEAYAGTRFDLLSGDRLLVFTDGLCEAENLHGQAFGDVRLSGFLQDHDYLTAEEFADRLLREVLAWGYVEGKQAQADDITLVVIDVLGGTHERLHIHNQG
ncbi:MAG TPA: PP2C family protein-serine/threonine phosphatase [Acidobacteriaceae bacterium]